jgi:uncharacterized membrane protein YgaE (UPF0421/DUF939 family)
MALSTRQGTVQLSIRAAIAAGASVGIAQLLDLPGPMYAMIGAIVVSDLKPQQTRLLGLRRVGGTIVGALIGAASTASMEPGTVSITLAVMLSMFACHALRLTGGATISGIVSGLLVLEYSAEPWSYALVRTGETLLGIAVAVVVSLVPKLIPVGGREPSGDGGGKAQ